MLSFQISRLVAKHLLEFSASLKQPEEQPEEQLGEQSGLFLSLYGKNGSGKSSLLNMLAGIERPDSGRIDFGRHCLFDSSSRPKINLAPEARRIGYVFQDQRLFPHMNIKANLRYASKVQPNERPHSASDFDEIVEALSLEELLARYPSRLSGGEQQRVALARALLASPRLLLLDEPLSSLDRRGKRQALRLLGAWTKQRAITVLYVSHDMEESAGLATHALTIKTQRSGSGQSHSSIASIGKIEEVSTRLETSQEIDASDLSIVTASIANENPINGLWRASLNKTKLFSGGAASNPENNIENKQACAFELSTSDGKPPPLINAREATSYVRIRAEDVLLATKEDPRALSVELLRLSARGSERRRDKHYTAQLLCGEQRLLMRLNSEQAKMLKEQRKLQKSSRERTKLFVRIRKAEGGLL